VAQKKAQAEQAYYTVAETQSPISKIRGERPIPFYSVAGFAVVYTLPYIQRFLKNVRLKQKKTQKRYEEEVSFFVSAYVMIRPIEMGECLVATESCDILNDEFDLNPVSLNRTVYGRRISRDNRRNSLSGNDPGLT